MKIPSSSSILLATLAISSSSTSLAAPTHEGNAEGGISSSQSNGHMASLHHPNQPAEAEGVTDHALVERETYAELQARDACGTLGTILGGIPVVGNIIQSILCPNPDNPSSQSAEPNQEDLMRLQIAVDSVKSALAGVSMTPPNGPLPTSAAGSAASNAPIPSAVAGAAAADVDSGGQNTFTSVGDTPHSTDAAAQAAATPEASESDSFLVSPTTTVVAAEAAEDTLAPSDSLANGAASSGTPNSPGVPAGPPNTPNPTPGSE